METNQDNNEPLPPSTPQVNADGEQPIVEASTSSYARLTQQVRSFLNSSHHLQSTSMSIIQSELNPSIGIKSSLEKDLKNRKDDDRDYDDDDDENEKNKINLKKFKPNSNLFDKLIEESSGINQTSKNQQIKSHKMADLIKLTNLFSTHENYYCTMYMPITDNFKLESQLTVKNEKKKEYPPAKEEEDYNIDDDDNSELSNDENKSEDEEFNEAQIAYVESQTNKSSIKLNMQPTVVAVDRIDGAANETKTDNFASNSTDLSSATASAPSSSTSTSTPSKQKSNEFHTCSLCSHCLFEPITLVCGCSFCRNCLDEFNLTLIKIKLKQLAQKDAADNLNKACSGIQIQFDKAGADSDQSDNDQTDFRGGQSGLSMKKSPSSISLPNPKDPNKDLKSLSKIDLFRCFNCGKVHEQNTTEHLRPNKFLAKLVDKLWDINLRIKILRNDIRNFICFNLEYFRKFDLNMYELMFSQAYNFDPSNHLILVDLFLINYFSGNLDKCFKYADMVYELRPNWAFCFFMKAICYYKIGDLTQLKSNLFNCLQLDPTIEQIRIKLFQVNYILLKSNYMSIACKTALSCLKKTDYLKYSNKSSTLNNNRLTHSETKTKSQAKYSNVTKRTLPINYLELNELTSLSKLTKVNKNFSNNENETSMSTPHENNDKKSMQTANDQLSNEKHWLSNSVSANEFCEQDFEMGHQQLQNQHQLFSHGERSQLNYDSSKYFIVNSLLIKPNDLECSLCYRLLYDPVTTPCGHSYCCSCLDRSLDHQDRCPLCKYSLAYYLAERRKNVTTFLDNLIKRFFEKEFEERKKQHEEEVNELMSSENEIPIFICTLALPFAQCPLHIYEPRYRLMLRRAIETGSKQFGMCMYTERTSYHYTEYGCMLEIKNYQFTRDGRAVVSTVGGRRFKVLRSSAKDGYNVAKVEWVKDVRVESETEKAELQNLHDEVYRLALAWYTQIPEAQKNKILEIYGINEIPEPEIEIQANDNGPFWHWFLLNILPLGSDFQYKFLTKTSLKDRLKQIKKIISILMAQTERSRQSSGNNANRAATSSSLHSQTTTQSLTNSSIETNQPQELTNSNNNNHSANSSTISSNDSNNQNMDTTQSHHDDMNNENERPNL